MPDADDAPWYERVPQRVEWEKDELLRHGFAVREEVGEAGLAFLVDLAIGTSTIPVRVSYPAEFPEIHPTVYGPSPAMSRHQHPSGLNFCLASEQGNWLPWESGASLVVHLVDLLTADARGDSELIHSSEADMPEPVSVYLGNSAKGVVLVPDPFWAVDLPTDQGAMRIGRVRRGILALLLEAKGLGSAEEDALNSFRYEGIEEGKWAAYPGCLEGTKTDEDLAQLVWTPETPAIRRRHRVRPRNATPPRWLGLTFVEEGPERDQQRRNWVFLRGSGQPRIFGRFRAQAFSRSERDRRVPELRGLNQRSILLIGSGSIGSAIAVELVKAGLGHLTVVDPDIYDVNNSVRHPLPLGYAGTNKAEAISAYCHSINAFADVTALAQGVSGTISPGQLRDLVTGADLTVDATGSGEIMRLLSLVSHEVSRPLLVPSLTSSAYGAEVVLGRPGGACPYCFELAQAGGRVPTPLSGPPSAVTPVGCSQPTFFGAGFEASELAAIAARVAIAGCGETDYPPLGYDWVVLNFRGDPHWQSGTLERDSRCPYHQ